MGKKLDYDTLRKKDLLAYAGAKTGVDYHVPWRADNNPSLRFFRSKEEGVILFKDMAGGSEQNCGTIIDFVRQVNHLENDKYGRYKAAQIVDKWQQGQEIQLDSTPGTKNKGRADISPEITAERREQRYKQSRIAVATANQSNYLSNHNINMQPWMQQSLQAYTDARGNLAYQNEAGDIMIKGGVRADTGKTYHDIVSANAGDTATNTISIAGDRQSKNIVVVEGVGDAIAHADMFKKNPEGRCYIILNSTSNAGAAIDYIKASDNDAKVNLWLDNDKSGINATSKIIDAIPHAVNNTPRIEEYNKKHGTDCKDLGDIYQAEKHNNNKTDDNTKAPAKSRDEMQIER